MNSRLFAFLTGLATLAFTARAADPAPGSPAPANPAPASASPAPEATAPANPPPPKRQATVAEIRARLLDHLRKKNEEEHPKVDPKAAKPAPAAAKAEPAKSTATEPDPNEPTKVLPKFEVKQMPITELDLKVAQQNREIAAEKKNTEPTPLDETLNGKKISKIFSFLGGQSSDQRASIASERVSIMEEERDLIEAIAEAQTKDEKAELEKALADLRQTRRELEQSLR